MRNVATSSSSPAATSHRSISAGPAKATIEVVRACNLRCPACPVGNGLARQWPIMALDTYQRIIDACSGTLEQLSLFNYGEPLLCHDIDRYVLYAKKAGIRCVILHTNGLLLSARMAENLLAAGLDRLTVSLDAVDAETYAKYRMGGDFSVLLRNIQRFVALRDGAKRRLPQIEGQFIVMAHNEYQVNSFIELCRTLRVDVASIKTCNVRMDLTKGRHNHLEPANLTMIRHPERPEPPDLARDLRACSWPRTVLTVNADATIVPCGYDYNNWNPIGSFRCTLRDEWWDTRERRAFVDHLETAPFNIPLCRNCPRGVISILKSTVINRQS